METHSIIQRFCGILALTTLFACKAIAEPLRVAVASNFRAPMEALAKTFEETTGHKALLSFGASGKFFAQIQHGAPFHILLSADQAKPEALIRAGLAVSDSRFTYANGILVLWSSQTRLQGDLKDMLESSMYSSLALANPKLAPYGAAAINVLTYLDLQSSTRGKWIQGENIAQAFQFVYSGAADLGFVAESQLRTIEAKGQRWTIPKEMYDPIRQDAVLLTRARKHSGAKQLLDFLKSDPARQLIKEYGYVF